MICALSANAGLTVKAIAVGGGYGFALASDGTVWTWGEVPVEVSGISGVVAIAANSKQCLAVKNDGTVWAWDFNGPMPFGPNGPLPFIPTAPAQIKGLNGIAAISAGGAHALALKNDGTVWAWGGNSWGTLGNGTTVSRTTPAQVSGLTGVIGIAAGQAHSLAVKMDGTVWAWGDNQWGQLGNGSTTPLGTPNALPVRVTELTGAVAVAAGYGHSLALKSDGTLWAWGHNGSGQLGDGTNMNVRPTPQPVGLIGGVTAIAAADFRTLAVRNDGTLWHWGMSETPTAIPTGGGGINYTNDQLTPLQMDGITGIMAVAGNLALKGDGTVWALSSLWNGVATVWGDGVPAKQVAPGRIPGIPAMASVSARRDGGLALARDGSVWEWQGQSAPSRVSGLTGVTAVAAGSSHSLALLDDRTVMEWTPQMAPAPVRDLSDVKAIAAGDTGSLALKRDGSVWQWFGQSTPVEVNGLNGVTAIAVAFDWMWDENAPPMLRGLALRNDGTVWEWGSWVWPSGETSPVVTNELVQVPELSNITSIAGGDLSMAVKADGTVWEWNESTMDTWAPVQVEDFTGATAAAVGTQDWWSQSPHCLVLKNDGTVWAKGANARGQLGDGTTITRDAAVQVALLTNVDSISAAGYHSLALKRDGTVWAWGDTGDAAARHTPVQVIQPGSPDLAIAMQHAANFTVAESASYTLTITNVGQTATAGAITVIDTLPPGLSHLSSGGDGFSCLPDGQVITCTNPGPIGPGASGVIKLAVAVKAQAWPGVTNLAIVSNESDHHLTNNTIGDPVAVKPR